MSRCSRSSSDFAFRRFAVVARQRDVQVARQKIASQFGDLLLHALRNQRGIGAFAFRQRDRDRRILGVRRVSSGSPRAGKQHVAVGFGRAVFDFFGDVAQIDGPASVNADDDLLKLFGPGEEVACFHLKFPIVSGKASGLGARVRRAQLHDDRAGSEAVRRELLRIENHTHFSRLAADDGGFRNVIQLLQRVFQLSRDSPQLVAVVVFSPQRHREDGHVVDRTHFDQRLGHARRNPVKIRVELVVGLDDRVFFLRADVEAHNQHAHAGMADRVDVLDAGKFAQQLFHRHRGAFRHFLRGRPRHLHKNVQHRHDDLRFFLARRLKDRENSEDQSGDNHQRRQLGFDENVRDPAREARDVGCSIRIGGRFAHGRGATCLPLSSLSPGAATSFSPSCKPDRISTVSPEALPRVT